MDVSAWLLELSEYWFGDLQMWHMLSMFHACALDIDLSFAKT